jgi:hypothetical protein
LRRRMSLVLAQLGHASCARQCPQLGVDRKTFARREYFRV